MTRTSSLTADNSDLDDEMDNIKGLLDAGGVISFLFAGTILFASLVIGSSVSLLSAGSYTMTSAILHGFLSLGLWAFGGFFAALVLAFAIAAIRRRRHGG